MAFYVIGTSGKKQGILFTNRYWDSPHIYLVCGAPRAVRCLFALYRFPVKTAFSKSPNTHSDLIILRTIFWTDLFCLF